MATGYVPELDDSPELDADRTTTVQELIGILRWAIELERVDIFVMRFQYYPSSKPAQDKDT